jgi:hypothetical protein
MVRLDIEASHWSPIDAMAACASIVSLSKVYAKGINA